jgi:membrane-bound inhibitor of C-type lysozyme
MSGSSNSVRYLVGLALIGLAVVTGGCGSIANLWPFGESKSPERTRVPANATEYRCEGGKTFYVRYLEDGAAWVFFPERQVRLEKAESSAGTRYTNGIATLKIEGAAVTLTDGPSISYLGCRTPG